MTRSKFQGPVLRLLLAGVLTLPAIGAMAAGDATAGKALFQKDCVACHKRDASGGVKLGDTESADLRSPGLEKMYHQDDALIRRAILDGLDEEGGELAKIMPRWAKRGMTTAQADDIIAYLHEVGVSK